jgi:hypothetical protein
MVVVTAAGQSRHDLMQVLGLRTGGAAVHHERGEMSSDQGVA